MHHARRPGGPVVGVHSTPNFRTSTLAPSSPIGRANIPDPPGQVVQDLAHAVDTAGESDRRVLVEEVVEAD